MSDTLYRRTESGTEAFYPATTAARVAYGDGTVEAELDSLAQQLSGFEAPGMEPLTNEELEAMLR